MRNVLFVALLIFSAPAMAKGDKILGNTFGFFAVGVGTATYFSPEDKVDASGLAMMDVGADIHLFGPVYLPIAVVGETSFGKVQYDYTNTTDNVHYTASDVGYTRTGAGLRAGLKIRIINAKYFHFYVDGGVLYSAFTINYDTFANTTLASQGSNPLRSEKDMIDYCGYGEAGVEFLFGKFGIRLAGRTQSGHTSKLKGLADQSLKHKDAVGLIGLLKDF